MPQAKVEKYKFTDCMEKLSADFIAFSAYFDSLSGKFSNMSVYIDMFSHLVYYSFRVCHMESFIDFLTTTLYVMANVCRDIPPLKKDLLKKIKKEFFKNIRKIFSFKSESGDVKTYGTYKKFSNGFRVIVGSNFSKILRNFILNLVGLRLLPFSVTGRFIKLLGKPEKKSLLDNTIDLVGHIDDLMVYAEKIYHNGFSTSVFLEDSKYAQFMDKSFELSSQYSNIYYGKEKNFPSSEVMEHRVSSQKFLRELKMCLLQGEELKRRIKNNMMFTRQFNQCKSMFTDMVTTAKAKTRHAPIGFIIYGHSSIGKSSLCEHLYKLFARYKDLEWSRDLVFDRNPKSDYWDGYDSHANLIIHLPEPGADAKNLVKNKGCPVTNELLLLSDTATYAVNMAKLEDKGKAFAVPEMLVMDCNDVNMNLDLLLNNPAAIRRRFIYVHAKVKPQFTKEGGVSLDEEKVAAANLTHKMDLWDIDMYKQVPIDLVHSRKIPIDMPSKDIFGFSNTCLRLFSEHDKHQIAMENALSEDIDKYISAESFSRTFESNYDYLKSYLQIYFHLFIVSLYFKYLKWRIWWKYGSKNKNSFLYAFSVVPLVCAILLFSLKTTKLIAESGAVQSSGNFKGTVEEISSIEKKSKCGFPKRKSKVSGDRDWTNTDTFSPRIITSSRNLNDPIEITNTINKNLRYCKVLLSNGFTIDTMGLGLYSDYMLVNTHSLHGAVGLEVSSSPTQANFRSFPLDYTMLRDLGNDVTLIKMKNMIFKDIRFALIDGDSPRHSIPSTMEGCEVLSKYDDSVITVKHEDLLYDLEHTYKYIYAKHRTGLCGTPLIGTFNNRTFLLGIHSGTCRNSNVSYSSAIYASMCVSINRFMPIHSEGAIRLPKGKTITKVTKKSPLLYEDISGLNVIGALSDYEHRTMKSKLVKTKLLPYIEDIIGISPYDGNHLRYDIPMMRSKMVNNEYVSPYNNFIKKVSVIKKSLDNKIMDECIRILVDRLSEGISGNLSPVSLDIAQNGYSENFYYRSMKMSTSGGLLYSGSKRNWSENKGDEYYPNSEIREQVCEIISSYQEGETSNTLLGAQLKDEPRSFAKCQNGSTRVFAMSGYDVTLVNRMYLMPFYTLIPSNFELFRASIGINMHSDRAHWMFKDITSFSKNIFMGDYGGYDTNMPVDIGLSVNTVIYNFLKNKGYNDYSLKVVSGLLTDNLFPILCMEGNMFQVPGFQPSGKYATAEDNSLRGLFLLLYFFATTYTEVGEGSPYHVSSKFTIGQFFELTRFHIYGDDLVGSISDEIKEGFNNITYSKFCREVYGMKFTTPDKTQHTKPFGHPSEISFLKRNFVIHKDLGRFVAVLEKESLCKTLTWTLTSKVVSLDTQLVESSGSVYRELFFWSDRDEFSKIREKFLKYLTKITPFTQEDLESYFPVYDYLLHYYKENK